MTTYFIDNSAANASDKNGGTAATNPFASFAALSKITLQPGDTVSIKAGTVYNMTSAIVLTASGTADHPITITSFGDGAKPIINNISTGMYNDAIAVKGANYLTINGLSFNQASQSAINIDAKSSHITVQNNEMGHVGEGVILNGSNSLVTGNYMHDLVMVKNTPINTTSAATIAASNNDDYGATGIVIGGSNNELSFNKIVNAIAPSYDYGMDGGGFELIGPIANVTIHDNYVANSNGFLEAGGVRSTLTNINVYNNVALNDGDFAVIHNASGAYVNSFTNFQMHNNTIVNQNNATKAMATFFLDAPATAAQVNITNNIISLNDGDSVFKQQGTYHSNNLINLLSKATHLYNNWGMVLGAGEQFGNPGLADVASGNFTPTASGLAQMVGASISAKLQAVISGSAVAAKLAVSSTPAPTFTTLNTTDTIGNLVSTKVTNADGSSALTNYVTGQTYAMEQSFYTAKGALAEVDRFTAAGVLVYQKVVAAAGTTVNNYGSTGQKTSESVYNVDGSKTYTSFGVQGQTYASDHLVYNAAGQVVEEDQYSASGALLMKKAITAAATTVDHYSAGVLTQESVTYADGSRHNSNFAVTGQSYASEYTSINAAGVTVEYDQYSANKTLLLKTVTNAAGTTTDRYSAAGVLLSEGVQHTDGSREYTNYAVTGQTYAREHIVYNAAGKVVENDQYSASGTLLTKVVTNAAGTTTDHYSSTGALTSENIVHADGTRDYTNYAVSGQSYSKEHVAYAAGGAIVEVDRSAANGTLLYKQTVGATGSTTDTYNATGAHLTQTVVNADHSKDYWNFALGSGSLEHDSYGSNGALLLTDVTNANGSHKVNAYAGGLTLASHAGVADTFQSFGSDTFVFATGSGADTINKFHAGSGAGHDTIQIGVPGITSFAQLQAMMTTTDHVDTTIHLGATDTILLHQVVPSALTAANFQFVHHDGLVG